MGITYALGITGGHGQGGSASVPTGLDTYKRLRDTEIKPRDTEIEIISEEELAAAAAMSYPEEGEDEALCTCGFGLEDAFAATDSSAVDFDCDSDDAALVTTTLAAWVVEQAHRKVFDLRIAANYGRNVASFIAVGNTTQAEVLQLAMKKLPPH